MTAATMARQLAWDAGLDPDERARLPHPIDDFGAGFDGEPEPYKLAPDLTRIGVALIQAHPNRLGHLRQFTLAYLWADTLGAVKGADRWFKVVRPTKELAWALSANEWPDLAQADALVEFSCSAGRAAALTWWEMEAWVYAVLRTIEVNDEGAIRLMPFGDVLQAEVAARYGTWSPFLKRLADALHDGSAYQQRMDLEAKERQAEAVAAAEEKGRTQAKAELREVLVGVLS